MSIYETVPESYNTQEEYKISMYFRSWSVYRVTNLEASFRPGWNNYDGPYVVDSEGNDTFYTGAYGHLYAKLPYGAYTMEITFNGELYGYSNIFVGPEYYAYQLD